MSAVSSIFHRPGSRSRSCALPPAPTVWCYCVATYGLVLLYNEGEGGVGHPPFSPLKSHAAFASPPHFFSRRRTVLSFSLLHLAILVGLHRQPGSGPSCIHTPFALSFFDCSYMVLDRSIPDPLATMLKQQPCLGCPLQSRQYIWISVLFVLAGISPAQFPHLNSKPACFICSTLYYFCPVPFSFYARRLKIIIFNALSFYGDVPPRLRGRTASAIPARPPFRRRLHKRLTGFFVSTSMVASFVCCQTIQHFIVAFPSHFVVACRFAAGFSRFSWIFSCLCLFTFLATF